MKGQRKLITFDWAMKKLLRAKSNFKVLEGFLSELLRDDIRIIEILESEGNRDSALDKQNRVDLLVEDALKRRIIIEVQYTREDDYFQRMLYGTAKILSESVSSGESYRNIARVVSVNIVHFDLGQGDDYVYEGRTEFRGLHNRDRLGLNEQQKKLFHASSVEDVFPEYYILKVNNFDDVAKDGLDQWIYFLKNGSIRRNFTAKGLREANEALDLMKLSDAERRTYESHLHSLRIQAGVAESTILRAETAEKELEEERRQKEEERRQKEEERRQKEEERRQKEEAQRQIQTAYEKLIENGFSEKEAKKLLGI